MFKRSDPANVGKERGALELAQKASMILINLYGREKYRV